MQYPDLRTLHSRFFYRFSTETPFFTLWSYFSQFIPRLPRSDDITERKLTSQRSFSMHRVFFEFEIPPRQVRGFTFYLFRANAACAIFSRYVQYAFRTKATHISVYYLLSCLRGIPAVEPYYPPMRSQIQTSENYTYRGFVITLHFTKAGGISVEKTCMNRNRKMVQALVQELYTYALEIIQL